MTYDKNHTHTILLNIQHMQRMKCVLFYDILSIPVRPPTPPRQPAR